MKKILIVFSILAVIFLVSGGYALMSSDNGTNEILTNSVSSEELQTNFDSSSNANSSVYNNAVSTSPSGEEVLAANVNTIDENSYVDMVPPFDWSFLNDLYVQCTCGKFMNIGEMTREMPQEMLCQVYFFDDISMFKNYIPGQTEYNGGYVYTYEEVFEIWGPNLHHSYYDDGVTYHEDDVILDDEGKMLPWINPDILLNENFFIGENGQLKNINVPPTIEPDYDYPSDSYDDYPFEFVDDGEGVTIVPIIIGGDHDYHPEYDESLIIYK